MLTQCKTSEWFTGRKKLEITGLWQSFHASAKTLTLTLNVQKQEKEFYEKVTYVGCMSCQTFSLFHQAHKKIFQAVHSPFHSETCTKVKKTTKYTFKLNQINVSV